MPTLHELIDLYAVPAPARTPFWIDDPFAVWCVRAGALDVFAQRRDASGAAAGARHHVFRAAPGALVLGVDFDDVRDGWGFLAAPLPATLASRLTQSGFAEVAAAGDARAGAIALLGDWVSAAMRGPLKPLPPKHYQTMRQGEAINAAPDECLSPDERLAWMAVSTGDALWMGRPDAVINARSGPAVLTKDVWIKASGALAGEMLDPFALLADGRIWRALALHHRFVLRYALTVNDELAVTEEARLKEKAARSSDLTRAALARLIAVGDFTRPAERLTPTSDVLFGACELIGRRLNVGFRAPPPFEREALERDPVGTVAAASNLRFRQVALKDKWWESDGGPLLATHGDSKEWVALLPARDRQYEVHHPATGKVERVTQAVAKNLGAFAYVFYRSFPGKPLGLLDILRFGSHGIHRDIGMVMALGCLIGLLGLVLPIASGKLIDTIIPSADQAGIWQMTGALIAATLAASLFELARMVSLLRVESKMDAAVQAAVWDRVLKLPVPFFRNFTAGDLAVRINGVNTIRHALSGGTVATLLGGVFSVFNLALLFYYSGRLAIIALVLVSVALTVVVGIGYFKLRYERQLAAVAGPLSGTVFQYLRGIAKLRVSAAESRAFANWAGQFTHSRSLAFRAQHLANIEHTIFSGYPVVASAVIFGAIGMLLFQPGDVRITTGEFIAFNAAFGGFFAALIGLAATALKMLNLVPVYERARPILQTLPESGEGRRHPGELQGGIEVMKLGFRYGDGPEVLNDVSFSIRPGGYIALVGPSGSGKSTLFRLLLGFEKPSSGSIYYDTQDLVDLDLDALRRQLGVVLQSGQLTSGDIFTNIVGTSHLTLDDAWTAARMVGLDEDIEQMPMGMHTVISEGASTISGGQRQRILIARAIVHRPRIVYFDEATSALDNRTQAIVTESLGRLKATRIVIAHRLSTVVNADRILVLQDGRIVQNGNYAKLLSEPGPFAELAKRQMM